MSFEKNIWGNTTWFLFHTIAHKINESHFNEIKNDIIYVIKTICNNLPCPECSLDASYELNKVNFDNINSKEQLKLLLFNFHNHINKKLNKPIFKLEELNKKYSKANFKNIYNNFLIIYSSNNNIPKLMNASFHRQNSLNTIKIKLHKIMTKFD